MAASPPAALSQASLQEAEAKFLENPITGVQGLAFILALVRDPEMRLPSLNAARRCFVVLLERGDICPLGNAEKSASSTKSLDSFREWASASFFEFFNTTLMGLLHAEPPGLAATALLTALEFCTVGRRARKLSGSGADLLVRTTRHLSMLPAPLNPALLAVVRQTMFNRLKLRSLRAIRGAAASSQAGSGNGETITARSDQAENLVTLLELVEMPADEVDLRGMEEAWSAGDPGDGEEEGEASGSDMDDGGSVGEGGAEAGSGLDGWVDSDDEDAPKPKRAKVTQDSPSRMGRLLAQQRKAFQEAWLATLKLPMRPHVYKRVLLALPERVIPFMPAPRKLSDYLTDSYRLGGLGSVLALSSLFILMRVHNLDYPGFYRSLYATLEPSVFHAKHRARFYRLLTLCLCSRSLPAHVLAAFLKKLNRLALSAPPSGALYVIALTKNLLLKHRLGPCIELIQSGGAADAYDVMALDPADSSALGSGLWELHGLKGHYLSTVSGLCKDIQRPWAPHEAKLSMEQYTQHTYRELFNLEKDRKTKKTPLNFTKTVGILHSTDYHAGVFGL